MLARSGAAFGLQRLIKRLINPSRQHVGRGVAARFASGALMERDERGGAEI
jgi:hypothetical protein